MPKEEIEWAGNLAMSGSDRTRSDDHDRAVSFASAENQIEDQSHVSVPATLPRALEEVLGGHMNAPVRSQEFIQSPSKSSLIRRLLRVLVAMLSSPKGDQGGWEGGARGL